MSFPWYLIAQGRQSKTLSSQNQPRLRNEAQRGLPRTRHGSRTTEPCSCQARKLTLLSSFFLLRQPLSLDLCKNRGPLWAPRNHFSFSQDTARDAALVLSTLNTGVFDFFRFGTKGTELFLSLYCYPNWNSIEFSRAFLVFSFILVCLPRRCGSKVVPWRFFPPSSLQGEMRWSLEIMILIRGADFSNW